MLKQAFIASLIVVSTITSMSSRSFAREIDIEKIQQVIQENAALDTEQKAANVLIAYSDLMGYLSADLISGLSVSTKNILVDIESQLARTNGTQDPRLQAALTELKNGIVTLIEGTNSNNQAVQALSQNVVALSKAKIRFPEAKFIATLDLMISLTQEFATNHGNYTGELNRYIVQMNEVESVIRSKSTETTRLMEELAATKQNVEKHSFSEIGKRFESIGDVLRMLYQE